MDNKKTIERLVLASIDAAQRMLEEQNQVIPFGVLAYAETEDITMKCVSEKYPDADWQELIDATATALKQCVKIENIAATAIVTSLESDSDFGVGIQVETPISAVLFIYPYVKNSNGWVINEPEQADILIAPRVFS